jgi:hypothetical protein
VIGDGPKPSTERPAAVTAGALVRPRVVGNAPLARARAEHLPRATAVEAAAAAAARARGGQMGGAGAAREGTALKLDPPAGTQPRPPAEASSGLPALRRIWALRPFRASALAYCGHTWELYGLWAFEPALVELRARARLAAALLQGGAGDGGGSGCRGGRSGRGQGCREASINPERGTAPASLSFADFEMFEMSAELSLPALVFVAIGAGALGNALGGLASLYAALPLRPPRRRAPRRGHADAGAAGDGAGADGGAAGAQGRRRRRRRRRPPRRPAARWSRWPRWP